MKKTKLTTKWLTDRGFKPLSWFTVLHSYYLSIGRNRYIGVTDAGGVNEMVFLQDRQGDLKNPKILDVIVLRNYDYDKSTFTNELEEIYRSITRSELKMIN